MLKNPGMIIQQFKEKKTHVFRNDMRQLFFSVLMMTFFVYPASYAAQNDTRPPTFKWISPQDYSILTTNTIRLCVDASDGADGSGIKKVMFYARYFDSGDRFVPRRFIGEVDTHPYEFLWDCSGIPDQNIGKLIFDCEVYDNAGNMTSTPDWNAGRNYPLLVLDRNPEETSARLVSHFTRKRIEVDGILNEWTNCDSIAFNNNDNRITVYSLWNRKNMYLGIRVSGRSIISNYPPGSENIVGMSQEDLVEVFIDPDHDHYEIFGLPDRHFLIAAAGMVYERKMLIDDQYHSELNLNPNVAVSVNVNGTLNDDSDEDIDYSIEFGITWEELGVTPGDGTTMGLEIWNNDKDFVDGNYFYAGWSTTASNLSNPSEWGNLVLVGGDSRFFEAGILAVIAAAGSVIAIFMFRRKPPKTSSQEIDENEYIRKTRQYVEEHFEEETLTREVVAPAVGLTPSYFGKVFKQETGLNFTDYLTDFRIEKAKKLLISSQKNISEIALEVGFSNQSYFAYQFKKRNGVSPSEFRHTSRKNHVSLKN